MADTARAAGVGPEIEHDGTVYRFKPLDALQIGKFEVWLERRAFEAVLRQQSWMPAAEYAEQVAGVRRDCAADVYAYGGEYFGKASVSVNGIKRAVYLSLKAGMGDSPDVTEQLASALFEQKRDQVLSALFAIRWLTKPPEAPGAQPQ